MTFDSPAPGPGEDSRGCWAEAAEYKHQRHRLRLRWSGPGIDSLMTVASPQVTTPRGWLHHRWCGASHEAKWKCDDLRRVIFAVLYVWDRVKVSCDFWIQTQWWLWVSMSRLQGDISNIPMMTWTMSERSIASPARLSPVSLQWQYILYISTLFQIPILWWASE